MVRFDLNTETAALVTEPVVVPSRIAFTLASVAASTSNDASTARMDWTCEEVSPEAGVAGTAGATVGTAGVAGVALEPELELELTEVPPEQEELLGVTVMVCAEVPTYLRTDAAVVHVLVVLSVVESTLRIFLFGAVTCMEDPS